MFRNSGGILIFSLSLLIFLLLLLSWSVLNSTHLSRNIRENLGFQIYIKDSISGPDKEEIQQKLDHATYVKQWIMVSKETAASELKAKLGEDFIGFLGYNPLLDMLDIRVKAEYANLDSLDVIMKDLSQLKAVHEIVYQKDIIDKINRNLKTLFYFMGIFALSLLVVALFLMNNTIRLLIYSQRFIIRTMYLVGATRMYITRPFILRSALQGMVAGGLGMLMFSLIYVLILRRFPEISELSDVKEVAILMLVTLIFSIIITIVGTFISAFRLVNLKSSELYQ